VLTASAASPVVAQLLRQLADGLAPSAPMPTLAVTDVAPTPAEDPRGAGLSAGALPLTIGGIVAGTLMALLVRGLRQQLLGATSAAALAGFVAVMLLHGWLGSLQGNVVAEWAALSGGVVTMALLLIAMHALLGRPGLVLTELTLVLLGNPLSAATSAPELLPTGWSAIGQWMPLGATVDLLRGVSGFDGRATAAPTLALAGWTTLALMLLLAADLRRRTRAAVAPRTFQAVPA
jgi:hypothetical protein